jgi:ABC-type multidrug transport system fused ATPase/permease subunit
VSEKIEKVPPQLCEMENTLQIDDVSFSYKEVPTIKHINILFERGKKYAIVGKSGSGKSTLLKLLAGYYGNYSGQILVDGNSDIQCDCALIHQNVFLFDDTIHNNITLGGAYTEHEILAAVQAAGLANVIQNLPDGIDTQVEENGSRFSGGEKQRIAIARAILHRKSVFLVDEATSSLDKETAQIVEESLLSMDNVTCITVTHRRDPEIMRKYDEILEMENGSLVKVGVV